jgi:AraC-like DNA-binding protein/ligand-binding sensor protein
MALVMEYVFQPEVQQILDDLCALFGVRAIFLWPSVEELRVGGQRTILSYCRKVQHDLGLLSVCQACDGQRCRESARLRRIVSCECHAGPNEAVAPVCVDGLLLGLIMIGQVRLTARPPARITRRWLSTRRDERQLVRAFAAAPLLTVERMHHVLRLFDLLVRFIARQHLIGIRGCGIIRLLLLHMAEHIDEPLSLEEAARLVSRSPSTVSQHFRRLTGRGFKQTQIEARLRKAEEYLTGNPELQIIEIASRVGYPNAHYFSRLFRKYRGQSPGQCRLCAGGDSEGARQQSDPPFAGL